MITIYIFILLLLLNFISAFNNIWIIRHCDEINDTDRCCSSIGYNRSTFWGYLFTNHYFNSKVNINIYATGSSSLEFCKDNIRGPINNKCKKSQRMVLTANYIYNNITYNDLKYNKYTRYNVNPKINTQFCAGDEKLMANDILKNFNDKDDDIIIVWRHENIVDIINAFGIKLSEWPKKIDDYFHLIFMINKKKMYYGCLDFIENNFNCDNEVNKWLKNHNKLYLNNYLYMASSQTNPNTSYEKGFVIFCIVLFMIVTITLVTYCFLVDHNIIFPKNNKYTPIN